MVPTVVAQLNYELESMAYNIKRKSVEYQMEQLKNACEKLRGRDPA